jgi:hypothetical protein
MISLEEVKAYADAPEGILEPYWYKTLFVGVFGAAGIAQDVAWADFEQLRAELTKIVAALGIVLENEKYTAWEEGYIAGLKTGRSITYIGHNAGLWSDPPNPYTLKVLVKEELG